MISGADTHHIPRISEGFSSPRLRRSAPLPRGEGWGTACSTLFDVKRYVRIRRFGIYDGTGLGHFDLYALVKEMD